MVSDGVAETVLVSLLQNVAIKSPNIKRSHSDVTACGQDDKLIQKLHEACKTGKMLEKFNK